jgi:uncharacterized protein YceH (UPF0502 family)
LRKVFEIQEGERMSAGTEAPTAVPPGPWPVLDVQERRVLGVLVEKAKTTPDNYPLSVNALVSGCNQKSNRDPLLNLSDPDVEDALARCQKKGLAIKITGGRVVRWRHNLYEAWRVDKVDLAIVAELLLRGPQTEGELRTRVSRMEPLDDLDALRGALKPLLERGLVIYLTPEDRRGAILTHGFHDSVELDHLRGHFASSPALSESMAQQTTRPAPAPPGPDVQGELTSLREAVADLQAGLRALREELRALKQSLGA